MSKLKYIIENELDWVKNVNEHDNFFNWFKSPGAPGKWIQKDTQSWIEYVQDVQYAMSVINSDITEMKTYSDRILDGDAKPKEMKENLDRISEFVTTRNNTNDIDDYITDMRGFLNHFTPYFGEDMTMSDMVESVELSFQYAQENNIGIHRLREDINEDFDWAVKDTVPFLEIGEPKKVQTPKKMYRINIMHGTGEDRGTWVPNWMNYDPTKHIDILIRHVKILSWLTSDRDYKNVYDLAELYSQGGNDWILSKEDNQNIKNEFGEFDEEVGLWVKSEDEQYDSDDIHDTVADWLNDELMDYGLRDYDSYHQEDASIEDWSVTYFDEFGVEHHVKINLPQG
jgi:hypothetical protein